MKFKYIFIFLFLHINFLFAQSISLDFGKSYPGASFDTEWDSRYTVGFSGKYPINTSINLKPYLNYCSFKFDTGPVLEGESGVNFNINDHYILSFGIMINFELRKKEIVSPYIQTGLGYIDSNVEDINYTYGQIYTVTQGGFEFNSLLINMGAGIQLNIFTSINPYFEINYYKGFPGKKLMGTSGEFTYSRLVFGINVFLFENEST